jgi:hypothetical protein
VAGIEGDGGGGGDEEIDTADIGAAVEITGGHGEGLDAAGGGGRSGRDKNWRVAPGGDGQPAGAVVVEVGDPDVEFGGNGYFAGEEEGEGEISSRRGGGEAVDGALGVGEGGEVGECVVVEEDGVESTVKEAVAAIGGDDGSGGDEEIEASDVGGAVEIAAVILMVWMALTMLAGKAGAAERRAGAEPAAGRRPSWVRVVRVKD